MSERWGKDLRLLDNLERQNDRKLGFDLRAVRRLETDLLDLEAVSGAENLKQALLMRLLTPLGELAVLGHPSYGSRLFELIGERNTQANRNRAKVFILRALQAEPRVEKILSVSVTMNRQDPAGMDIDIRLVPIDSERPENLIFPFFLEEV
jgi:phage baseplate assembly protein W